MVQIGTKVVVYTRVSTTKQGADGYGIAAQDAMIAAYVAAHSATVIGRFSEVRSGLKDRPALKEAIALARASRAVLLCGKVDRIGRRASEVLTLLDSARVRVVFADMPHATDLQLGIMAVVAQEEARAVSVRTVAALRAARERGVKLGNYEGGRALCAYTALNGNAKGIEGATKKADEFARDLAGFVAPLVRRGLSDVAIAANLNESGFPTRRNGRWHETSVRRVRARLAI